MQSKSPRVIDSVLAPKSHGQLNGTHKRQNFFRYIPKNRTLTFVLIIIIIAGVGIFMWFHVQQPPLSEVAQVEQEVGMLYILPKNEQPALATVTNRSKLATPFLQQADNGDKILIYIKAKIVIIYRPSVNKLVGVGPVDISNPPQAQTNSVTN